MSQSDTHLSDVKFDSLNLSPVLAAGLKAAGFEYCTPIQAQTLPKALVGEDVAGQAQTGTGKTAAFLLATFNRLLTEEPDSHRRPTQPRALILAPTRELAIQIEKDAAVLCTDSGLKLGLAYGGTDYEKQRAKLEAGVDVLVGTPGRIIDYFKQKVFDLRAIEVAVLDEADRMFDLGFIKDIRFLLRRMPPPDRRLNLLFSATLSHRVLELAYEHMNEPELVKIEAETLTADRVTQVLYHVSKDDKPAFLIGLLRKQEDHRSLVFVNTRIVAEKVSDWLNHNGLPAAMLSGSVPQKKRESLLNKFQRGELDILVATDVAARGLHIPAVSHVFNYDVPQDCEDYVHRIGRTARAGATGDAVTFCCEEYVYSLPDIESYIGHRIPSEIANEDDFATDLTVPPRRQRKPRPTGNRSGNRGGNRGARYGGGRSNRGRGQG